MLLQVEITTRCNFNCYYCAGRSMPQRDMTLVEFQAVFHDFVAKYGYPRVVSLQGEGEPTLNHDFFKMTDWVREKGAIPTTTTNGTYKHPEHFVGRFIAVNVSVDTMDPERAAEIGRPNLAATLRFIERLSSLKIAVCVMTTNYGQDLEPIKDFVRRTPYTSHLVQPLQAKHDYVVHYGRSSKLAPSFGKFNCSYLASKRMRYYTINGTEMPCCFIKDESQYENISSLKEALKTGIWPKSCLGCKHGAGV